MKLCVFAIRDRATDQFDRPMFMLSEGQAIRGFTDGVNSSATDNPLYAHPDDYDLYCLGDFDTDSGMFSTGVPKQVVTGKQVAIREK